jgi:hypothetical protein
MKSLLAVILATTPAFADYHPYAVSPGPAPEPKPVIDRGYLGGGAGLALDHFFNSYLDLEGAVRVASLPLWIRGNAAAGNAFDFQGGGSFRRLRIGLETRTCTGGGGGCLIVGFDAGHQTQTWSDDSDDLMDEHHAGWVLGPRFGLDAGGDSIRFRLALDVYKYLRTSDVDGVADASQGGVGLSLALVHRM